MKRLKTGLLLGVIVAGSAFSVQASEHVHTYEQTANESFQYTVSQQTARIQQASDELRETSMQAIETEMPPIYDMNTQQSQKQIDVYKDDAIKTIQTEKEQFIGNMYADYEQDKQEDLQETITDDITDFLEEITK